MTRKQNTKAKIVSSIGVITTFSVWQWIASTMIVQNLFGGNALEQFIATIFISVIIACVIAGMVSALLSAIEQIFE